MAKEKYYTVKEIAESYNMTRGSLYNIIRRGEITSVTFGNSIRIPESALQDYLDRHTKKAVIA